MLTETEVHPDTVFVEEIISLFLSGNHLAIIRRVESLTRGRIVPPRSRERPRDARDLSLAEIGLPERLIGILEHAAWLWGHDEDGLERMPTAGLLCVWSAKELLSVPHLGDKAVALIVEALEGVRLRLRSEQCG